jgi:hypothetical protein
MAASPTTRDSRTTTALQWHDLQAPPGVSAPAPRRKKRRRSIGLSFEYLYRGNVHTNVLGSAPVLLGGRGDVVGSFNRVDFFFAADLNWKF